MIDDRWKVRQVTAGGRILIVTIEIWKYGKNIINRNNYLTDKNIVRIVLKKIYWNISDNPANKKPQSKKAINTNNTCQKTPAKT